MRYSRVMREWHFITFQIFSFFLLVIPLMGRPFNHPPNFEQVDAQSIGLNSAALQ
jgi:quinol-cytochrome oxidoreductase complex cytochrome b subunit